MSDIKWTEIPVATPEVHIATLEETLAHKAIKRLYQEVGPARTHLLSTVRITKHTNGEGLSMIATGSIRVYFVGRSTAMDIEPL